MGLVPIFQDAKHCMFGLPFFTSPWLLVCLTDASFDWETIEQYFLWQLIAAHNIPVEHIMPVLPKMDFSTHAEALTSIMIQLKQEWWVPSFLPFRPRLH